MPIQILKKHAKHFTADDRDKTKYVQFHDDGSVVMSDAFKLVRVLDVHSEAYHVREMDLVKKPKTKEPVPPIQFERLFPSEKPTATIELDVTETLANIASVAAMLKVSEVSNEPVSLKDVDGSVVITARGHTLFQYAADGDVKAKVHISEGSLNGLVISFNIDYFIQCLRLLKDFNYQSVTLELHSAMKPMVFSVIDEAVEMLMLPVRTY